MDEVLSECVLLTCAQPRQGPRCFRSWERRSLLWVHVQMLAPCAGKCHWWTLPSFRCLQPEIDHYRHSLPWLAKPVSLSMIHKTHTQSFRSVSLKAHVLLTLVILCVCLCVCSSSPRCLGHVSPIPYGWVTLASWLYTRACLHRKCWRDLPVTLWGPHLVTSGMDCLLLNTFARSLYHLVSIELRMEAWFYLILPIASTRLLAHCQCLVKICCPSSWV